MEGYIELFFTLYYFLVIGILIHAILFFGTSFIYYSNKKIENIWIFSIINIPFGAIGNALLIPLVKILLEIVYCDSSSKKLYYFDEIECYKIFHIINMIISGIALLIYLPCNLFYKFCFGDYICNEDSYTSKKTNIPEIYLYMYKLTLVVSNSFGDDYFDIFLLSFFFIFSLIVFYEFFIILPFKNNIFNKLYSCFMCIIIYTNFILIVLYFLRDSSFDGGIMLFIIGSIFILMFFYFYEIEEININTLNINPLKEKKVENILKQLNLLIRITDKPGLIRKNDLILDGIINRHHSNCVLKDCPVEKYIATGFKNSIYLYNYIERLFTIAINSNKNNVKLRTEYILFIYKKLRKIKNAKFELDIISQKCLTTINEEFCIFQLKKSIENSSLINSVNGNDIHTNEIQEFNFFNKRNYLIENIKNIVKSYIKFWTLLITSHRDIVHDLGTLATIGSKISSVNENIQKTFEELLSLNYLDKKSLRLYTIYQKEILNNSNFQIDKNLIRENYEENLSQKSFVIDEQKENDNKLNLEMEKNIIIISSSNENFGNIIQVSLNSCSLFGFTLEEIIGKNVNIIIPEIYHKVHEEALYNCIKKINQSSLINTENNIKLNEIESYAVNKTKYLIPFYSKIYYMTNEKTEINFIANIKRYTTFFDDVCYVLTNIFFQIQNFSLNCIKNLGLNSEYLNGTHDILNYIKQVHEELLNYNLDNSKNGKKNNELKILEIKRDIIKKLYSKPKKISWKKITNSNNSNISENTNIKKKESNNNTNNLNRDNSKISLSKSNGTLLNVTNFELLVEEIIINNKLYGYIFKFYKNLFNSSSKLESSKHNSSMKIRSYAEKKSQSKISDYVNNVNSKVSQEVSNVSYVNSINGDYLPNKGREFTLNYENLSYIHKPIKSVSNKSMKVDNFRDNIKKVALKKIEKINNLIKEKNKKSTQSNIISSTSSYVSSSNDDDDDEENSSSY